MFLRDPATIVTFVILNLLASLPLLQLVSCEQDNYRARVRVYVDKAGVDEFDWNHPRSNLTQHVENMFVTVNLAYRSLLPDLNLTLVVEQVIALDKNIFTHTIKWRDDLSIFNDWTGYDFWQWSKKTYDPKKYDLAVLLTGYEMFTKDTFSAGTFGHGYQSSVCYDNGVAAIEIQEPAGTLGLIHEIGHILGAAHDEQSPKRLCTPSTYQDGHIMNQYTKILSPLRFTFSKCSLLQIQENISNLTQRHHNCLLVVKDANVPKLQTTADELCKQKKGSDWRMNRAFAIYNESFCENIPCVNFENGERFTSDIPAPDGLKCGKNKRCHQQKCRAVQNGDANMSDTCPWGSQDNELVKRVYGYPCAELGCRDYPRLCCGHCQN